MNSYVKRMLTISTAVFITMGSFASIVHAEPQGDVGVTEGVGDTIANKASFLGDLDPNTQVTIDIVIKLQNKSELQQYINDTVTPKSSNYRRYLSVAEFKKSFAPKSKQINELTEYLKAFGIKSEVYQDNLIVTATGTADQINKAFNVELKHASYKGKNFHASKKQPKLPKKIADNILCILGLSSYSSYTTKTVKVPNEFKPSNSNGPLSLNPSDLIKHYNVQPLYKNGASGKNESIGIVTLAEFNPNDAYSFWKQEGIKTDKRRIKVINVDGGSGNDGADETTLDVEQSGALAPKAEVNVYVAPNTDPGFVDAFANVINENKCHQISASWGESEDLISYLVSQGQETKGYAEAFNQLFMQAAAQGISMFAAAGDSGAYDSKENTPPSYELSVDNPADSPYITAAGGTTLAWQGTVKETSVKVDKERAWGWDYLYPAFDADGLYSSGKLDKYFVGGGGGFSKIFDTPDYQKGISGVNRFTGVKQWTASNPQGPLLLNVTRDAAQQIVTGKDTGRNVPDISMDADPYTGYNVYMNGEMSSIGGTSIVAPQLAGLCALINDNNNTQVGFWNPQIYKFAQSSNSPLNPLNDTGSSNDNIFYTATKGTIYNQATGLGIPDIAKLNASFGR
ncbi:subtilase family serine protease [Clostridium acetobutylicum]|uniref:Possible periplasmic aspartyl protease n=1 Tax=Clostridium acetobutylicum (strain ATCC 824 / DSM 792 / JCM 1419 / IAM 19013 / LMG 5710 / NBRC 13948 / NRRL B-527 / VKM B-1787 / 2291 / W) TaxID=272562 RepID=Q97LD7_CLOAB|nr:MULTISPECIES: protease pro-enzyme activation domain-containing protein [Clostridium]AAK78602.1 Possible periplasmic aspartyl protease [Clostridium acetobutylicum ATCC 824]ADZ19676.1 putative periplasmic aspartyl protease [Clostridium acetobutylicum EA 2018]AEI33130.1 periplasmic aspartyl protease [Clostridium acetobutylicum DSM 1731]AWV80326.1 aspartyl protease [Clostridium acetobutylicum]MBC2392512.1 S8 family serine peptidase [Clostridium acetobutylicum]